MKFNNLYRDYLKDDKALLYTSLFQIQKSLEKQLIIHINLTKLISKDY